MPWQTGPQFQYSATGFVINGQKILTNSIVLAGHTHVLVKSHGSPIKYKAEVQVLADECNLALLTVESIKFWMGMPFVDLCDVPFWQEEISIVGYDQGADYISISKGVVSRNEQTQNLFGAHFMAMKIVGAFNPGNSGGPAIMGDKVVGVHFQIQVSGGAENIGYIIPVPIIERFLSVVKENGKYVGFCSLGISYQLIENTHLREYFHMRPEMSGVLVKKINPLSDAFKILKKDDIILAFDREPIANDGTVPFRNWERIVFDHLVFLKKPAEKTLLRVLRDGVESVVSFSPQPLQPLVPLQQFDKLRSYYIFAGLVFIPLTTSYLFEHGDNWSNILPCRLTKLDFSEYIKKAGEQLVILSQVLIDDINYGYENISNLLVMKVNGIEIENLKHLCNLVEGCHDENIRFDLDDETVLVLKYRKAELTTSRILTRHRIPSAMSSDLIA